MRNNECNFWMWCGPEYRSCSQAYYIRIFLRKVFYFIRFCNCYHIIRCYYYVSWLLKFIITVIAWRSVTYEFDDYKNNNNSMINKQMDTNASKVKADDYVEMAVWVLSKFSRLRTPCVPHVKTMTNLDPVLASNWCAYMRKWFISR